ncbi:MAG: hypothetical protein LUC43_08645, partial [Burkholderiales bacterium]|nr:hypothetical protein [Burkholderiales bacterium]
MRIRLPLIVLISSLLGMTTVAQGVEEPDPIEKIVMEAQGNQIKETRTPIPAPAPATTRTPAPASGVQTFPVKSPSKIEHRTKPIPEPAPELEPPKEAEATTNWADPEADQVV